MPSLPCNFFTTSQENLKIELSSLVQDLGQYHKEDTGIDLLLSMINSLCSQSQPSLVSMSLQPHKSRNLAFYDMVVGSTCKYFGHQVHLGTLVLKAFCDLSWAFIFPKKAGEKGLNLLKPAMGNLQWHSRYNIVYSRKYVHFYYVYFTPQGLRSNILEIRHVIVIPKYLIISVFQTKGAILRCAGNVPEFRGIASLLLQFIQSP